MEREISYEWSRDLVRIAARRFLIRYAGQSLIASLIVLAIGLGGLILDGGNVFWWLIAIPPVIYTLLWVQYYLRITKAANELLGLRVTIRIGPESMTFQTDEHTSTMKWSAIKNLWSFPEVLLVFTYNRFNYSLIPVPLLGEELKQYIEAKVSENGGKVT